jgi:hypothetical protein
MAGKIIVDTLQTESTFLQMNVGTTRIATMNVSGIFSNTGTKMIGSDGSIGAATVDGSALVDNTVTAAKIVSVANTQITGNITSSQIAPTQTFYGNTSITGLLDLSATNAGQIKFPASQNASSDANTLDDYEEGTFTPTLLSGTTTTYTTQAGVYTRIGRVVYFRLCIKINSIGNGNDRVIAGLPFSLVAPSNNEACVSVANLDSLATNVVSVYGGIYLSGGVPLINLTSATSAASGVGTSALFQNGTQIELGGFYFTT